MRKLVSIQKVLAIIPIPGADAIELAQINGWQCVVKKREFSVGDLGVYFEIDAVPPIEGPHRELFSFLWKGQDRPAPSLRIRTVKLRGQLSQGLLMPLAAFPELAGLQDGQDCTEVLGVHKYEPPPPDGMGDYGGPFDARVPKTDEPRLQSAPRVLDELRGLPYCVVEKCDGTSCTVTADLEGVVRVYGRSHCIAEADNIFWRAVRGTKILEAMHHNPDLAVQCEIVGPRIQKNRLGLHAIEPRAFNVFRKSTGVHLGQAQLDQLCREWEIPQAEVLERGDNFQHTQESLLRLADGCYRETNNPREGIVVRPETLRYSETLKGRLSFKVINNTFLLKGGD